ncbi:MAG: MG2 domain-containing protein, partial [Planctomycetes bacterium]|nr:MG2 domain-containing protein [Planctomycetota bacterium]
RNAFPDSIGGRRCFNLIQQIEAKSSQITTERVWNDPLPKITVSYRNLTKVYFRIVGATYEDRLKNVQYRPEYVDANERKKLLGQKPLHQWSLDLPATEDYQERTEEVQPPKDLKPGFYFLISSHDPSFGEKDNVVMFTDFWVSELALVIRTRQGQGVTEGFVLNAISGDPLANAQVQTWYQEQRGQRAAGPKTTSDENGMFRLKTDPRKSFLIYVTREGQALASARDYRNYTNNGQPRPDERTVFFTDRSLYRPGQTIQYKGICIHVDQERDNYSTITGRELTVIFADPNGKEVARQQHRSNDYGSFAGSFTAPRDRLTGRMMIRVEGEPNGATSVNVEEYKRPKFQVTLDKPETAAKLNSKVTLSGKATAYTGSPINDGQLRFRVVREVQYPIWWRWYHWWLPPQTNNQEIAHGTAITGTDGSFKIEFLAKPDLSVAEKDDPVFQYTVHADVTDITGETRSAQQVVRVGYTALEVAVTADDWQTVEKPVAIDIRTTTLDGEGQQAEGSLKIYRLKPPEKVQRAELSNRPIPYARRGAAVNREPEPDLSDPRTWPLGDVVAERGFTTDPGGKASFTFELPAGAYRAIVETQDRFGKAVTGKLPLQVLDPGATHFAIKIPYAVAAPEWTVEPGKEFRAVWGSGYERARAYVEVERRNKIIKSFWTDADRTQIQVVQEVTEAMRGGFELRVTMVRENRAYMTSRHVDVPWTNKDLKIEWEHFVSKLGPGEKQTWTAIISGPDAKKAVAEMVATL